jgi:hypothetical protein
MVKAVNPRKKKMMPPDARAKMAASAVVER